MKYNLHNIDCVEGSKKYLDTKSMDLIICDPPFGINETTFDKHYKRKDDYVLDGYVEAPLDYYNFTLSWVMEAKRVLKDDGSLYIISGWSKLREVLNAVDKAGLYIRNHIIWKYNFGVYTRNKFVTSHYHILYITKDKKVKPTFNQYCRFGPDERENNKSLNYIDLEDVWCINKEYHQKRTKNKNKLPDALVEKIILYSSIEGDNVCDFFQGNFTTAKSAINLGRYPHGFEINSNSFHVNMEEMKSIEFGQKLKSLKRVTVERPPNQGLPITDEDRSGIKIDYDNMVSDGELKKKDIIEKLCEKYGRGKFSIINIVKE